MGLHFINLRVAMLFLGTLTIRSSRISMSCMHDCVKIQKQTKIQYYFHDQKITQEMH